MPAATSMEIDDVAIEGESSPQRLPALLPTFAPLTAASSILEPLDAAGEGEYAGLLARLSDG